MKILCCFAFFLHVWDTKSKILCSKAFKLPNDLTRSLLCTTKYSWRQKVIKSTILLRFCMLFSLPFVYVFLNIHFAYFAIFCYQSRTFCLSVTYFCYQSRTFCYQSRTLLSILHARKRWYNNVFDTPKYW